MRNILNNILSILGYKIKRSKWLYENDKNLIATLKSQNINSIIDVGASSGQFAEQVFKNGFKGLIYSFEPLKKEHDILLIKSKKKEGGNWKIQKKVFKPVFRKTDSFKAVPRISLRQPLKVTFNGFMKNHDLKESPVFRLFWNHKIG